LSEHLVINAEQMRRNVADSYGLMLAEALELALTPYLNRTEAKKLVKEAAQTALKTKRHLVDVVREAVRLPLNWDQLRDEANYLGVSQTIIQRVLDAAKEACL
jgi:3-carboxy-cis,cis-muconate cycloisomerase